MAWARALAEKGWVAPHWPKEYGGAGLSVMEHVIFNEEMARARVPAVGGVGVGLLGPTLIAHGTEEQRREHLPKILSGEVVWAQGFSEPEAGSDLAALKTRAVRDGDHYVLNGQKIWTSHAQYADWLFALVRTDPEAPRHRGLTMLMMDIRTPGITVRPIDDLRGDRPFNEVFFEDVRVPIANRIGEEDRGWYVAMATLDFERSGIGGAVKYQQVLADLVAFMRSDEGRCLVRPAHRQALRREVAQRAIEIQVLYALALRTVWVQAAGEVPNYEASVNQLFSAELYQRLSQTVMKAAGTNGNLWQRDGAPMDGDAAHLYLEAVPYTVLSGTAEIQRNVIATRGLGLPRD
ncbi:MAG: acyl-CoA dehydrogenase family protein [Dehalococcoidia bacterium]